MQISLDTHSGIYHINSYQAGKVVINRQDHTSSILISSQELATWRPQSIAELEKEDFIAILALNPEVILLGTGERLIFPHPALLAACFAKNISVEVMDTEPLAELFEALAAENRRVVAGLLL